MYSMRASGPTPEQFSIWLRGVLDLCLLAVLEEEPAYGYEMTRRLTDGGLGNVADGSIYPALARNERAGRLESYRVQSPDGPSRKYYRLTELGRETLDRGRRDWSQFVAGVATVLAVEPPPATAMIEREDA